MLLGDEDILQYAVLTLAAIRCVGARHAMGIELGGKPGRSDGLTDAPDWDTVVPSGAKPTWRTLDEESNEEDEPKGPPPKSSPAQPKEREEGAPSAPPPPPGSGLG